MDINLVQLNVDRTRRVVAEIRQCMIQNRLDVLAVQEPYVVGGKIAGFGVSNRVIHGGVRGSAQGVGAAIVVMNKEIGAMKIQGLSDRNWVVAEIWNTTGVRFYLVSGYFKYADDIESYLDKMRMTVRALRGFKIVFCIDSNARSPMWGDRIRDARGEKMEEQIEECDLTIVNTIGSGPTFVAYRDAGGKSYIDLTLTTSSARGIIEDWSIKDDWVTCGHKAINMKVKRETGEQMLERVEKELRFAIKRADWDLYRECLRTKCAPLGNVNIESRGQVLQLVKEIESIIISAARESIPTVRLGGGKIKWWNKDIEKWKSEVNKSRRDMQRMIGNSNWENYRRLYKESLRRYRRAIETARRDSWERYIQKETQKDIWGLVYKMTSGKLRIPQVIAAVGGEENVTWEDSAAALLNGLIIDDEMENEQDVHRIVRTRVGEMNIGRNRYRVDDEQIRQAVWKCKSNKAPGSDNILVEFVKEGWQELSNLLVKMYNGCFKWGLFPNRWKRGRVVALLKGEEKPETEVRSYRPICLLPVLGKVMERLIERGLRRVFYDGISDRQYGYMKGRSTTEAMIMVRDIVESCTSKYCFGIFIDMTGAFDRLWWPGVIDRLYGLGVRGDLLRLINDYLNGRWVEMRAVGRSVGKRVSRGCPQGSVLGPQLWKITVDELLVSLQNEEINVVAFADDLVLLIEGRSRKQIEDNSRRALDVLNDWCIKTKMIVSEEKTVGMLLKGVLDEGRPPRVQLSNRILTVVDAVKYLGVVWGTRLTITKHIEYITGKAYNVVKGLLGVAKRYRVSYDCLIHVYMGVYRSIILYGAGSWGDKIRGYHRKTLLKEQRRVVLSMIRGYRTMSTDAALVIAGCPPIDFEIERYWASERLRLFGMVDWQDDVIIGRRCKALLRNRMLSMWQNRWRDTEVGEWTKNWFPSVQARVRMKWIKPDYYMTQMLSGHGNFKAKLKERGLTYDDRCRCGETDTVGHTIFGCSEFRDVREQLKRSLRQENIQTVVFKNLISKAGYEYFESFARAVLDIKEVWSRVNIRR